MMKIALDDAEEFAAEVLKNSINEINQYIRDNQNYHSAEARVDIPINFIPIYSDIYLIEDKKLKKLRKHLNKVLEYYSPVKA